MTERSPITVAELINWLSTQPAEAPVYLHDPDTGWFLKLRTGVSPDFCLQNEKDSHYLLPTGAVAVHAIYHE